MKSRKEFIKTFTILKFRFRINLEIFYSFIMFKFLKFILILVCLPGYLVVYAHYYFPTEWGKNRNVNLSARHFRNKHIFGPGYALILYAALIVMILDSGP